MTTGASDMKAGDKVQLISILPNLRDEGEMQTLTLFQKCLGQSFTVDGVEIVEGLPFPVARLDVGHVLGEEPWKHTIMSGA
jgi:hypothetical protein